MKSGSIFTILHLAYLITGILFCDYITSVQGACDADEYECVLGGTCISNVTYQDGINDCGDNSDEVPAEMVCQPATNIHGTNYKFTCPNGFCVPLEWVQDGAANCEDGADEGKHIGSSCTSPERQCCKEDISGECTLRCRCEDYVANSACIDDECQCVSGYEERDNRQNCTLRRLGSSCTPGEHAQCYDAVSNSICSSSVCKCDYGYKVGEDLNSCERRQYNDTCTYNIDCSASIINSICVERCVCMSGYLINAALDECLRVLIGETPCTADVYCQSVSNAECRDSVCQCRSGYHASNDRLQCERTSIGDPCSSNSVCLDSFSGSTCNNGVCACADGFRQGDTLIECIQRQLNDSCYINTDCSAAIENSVCTLGSSVCACADGYAESQGLCVERIIGTQDGAHPCTTNEDCNAAVEHSVCVAGDCECDIGYVVDTTTNATCNARTVNSSCTTNEECSAVIEHGECVRGDRGVYQCGCSTGHHPSDDGTDCLQNTIGDGECGDDNDCVTVIQYSNCTNGVCHCVPGRMATLRGTVCSVRRVSDRCDLQTDCGLVRNSSCINNRCRCDVGFYSTHHGHNCTQRELGEACEPDSTDCSIIPHAVCSRPAILEPYTCQCGVGYLMETPTACRPPVLLVDSCTSDEQCSSIPHASCVNNTCSCNRAYVMDSDANTCNIRSVGDGPCSDDAFCRLSIYQGVCINNRCACPQGYQALSGGTRCSPRTIGSSCSTRSDCDTLLGNTTCSGGVCACNLGYYSTSTTHCENFQLGDSGCDPGDCYMIPYSECISGTCSCAYGYSAVQGNCACDNFKNGYCIIIEVGVTLLNATEQHLCQKYVPNSFWSNTTRTCLCQQGYAISDNLGSCEARGYNSSCTTDADCVLLTNATCPQDEGTCLCSDGFIYSHNASDCIRDITPTSAPSTKSESCSFTCEYPWFVPVVVSVGALALLGAVVGFAYRHVKMKQAKKNAIGDSSKATGSDYDAGETPRPPTRTDTRTTFVRDVTDPDFNKAEGLATQDLTLFRGKTILAAVTE